MTNQRLVLEFSQTAHSILPSVFVRTNDTSDSMRRAFTEGRILVKPPGLCNSQAQC
jgi:hypothetical protein